MSYLPKSSPCRSVTSALTHVGVAKHDSPLPLTMPTWDPNYRCYEIAYYSSKVAYCYCKIAHWCWKVALLGNKVALQVPILRRRVQKLLWCEALKAQRGGIGRLCSFFLRWIARWGEMDGRKTKTGKDKNILSESCTWSVGYKVVHQNCTTGHTYVVLLHTGVALFWNQITLKIIYIYFDQISSLVTGSSSQIQENDSVLEPHN
jgi:hypothetical protein